MNDHIAIIQHQPAFTRLAFDSAFFPMMRARGFEHGFGERVEHAVAGAVAQDEIICKGCNVFDIEEEDVFALFVLQGVDYRMGKVKRFQRSPRNEKINLMELNTTAYTPNRLVSSRSYINILPPPARCRDRRHVSLRAPGGPSAVRPLKRSA